MHLRLRVPWDEEMLQLAVTDMRSCFRNQYALLQTCRAGRSGLRSDQGEDQSPRRNNEGLRAENTLPVRAMEAWQFATLQGLSIWRGGGVVACSGELAVSRLYSMAVSMTA